MKSTHITELENSSTSADAERINSQSNTQLLTREPIKNTPFTIVGNEEQGYIITMGKYKLSEPYKTNILADLAIKRSDWMLTINVMALICELKADELKQTFNHIQNNEQ